MVLRYWSYNQIQLLYRAETLLKDSRSIFLCWDKISGESEFRKDLWYQSEQIVWILLFIAFWLVDFYIWQWSFSYKYVTACFWNFLVLQGILIGCNVIFKCNDSLMFQNSFFTKIPYSSQLHKKRRVDGIQWHIGF